MTRTSGRPIGEEGRTVLLVEVLADLQLVRQDVRRLSEQLAEVQESVASLPLDPWRGVMSRKMQDLVTGNMSRAATAADNVPAEGLLKRPEITAPAGSWRAPRPTSWWYPIGGLAVAFTLGILVSGVLSFWR